MSSESIDRGFAILRVVLDPVRGVTLPVGAAAWDPDREWFNIRTIDAQEKLRGLDSRRRRVVSLSASQLTRWAREGRVPYAEGPLNPAHTAFWRAAGKALTSSVLLDSPKAVEPIRSDDEFQALFEALVQPSESHGKRTARSDGALTAALGALADIIPSGLHVNAFGQRREKVRRGVRGRLGTLIVEAVNLAAKDARHDADALVSRLLRILSAEQHARVVIGYRSSPGGLNGETDLRDWMKSQVTENVYDLARQSNELREATARTLAEVGAMDPPPPDLFSGV